jgi:phage/plasmid-like protein (TIGR03299 family)
MATSILDSVLDATTSGARIVSEQHDTGRINWARGLSDPGEMIACGYMPELRRRAGENDTAYQQRLETMAMPDGLLARIKNAALRRAELDTSNGRVNAAFAKTSAWHGLGVVLDRTMTSAEAIRHAGLDVPIHKRPMWRKLANGTYIESDETFETVRSDNEHSFGVCGPLYTPIQNVDAFAFLDGVISEFGAEYESAGSLYNGEQIWILAHLPKQDFKLNGSTMKAYAAFINYHKQGKAGKCFATDVRLECANTTRVALNKDGDAGLSIRHSGNIKEKMVDARQALGMTVRGIGEFKEQAEYMYRTPVNLTMYANEVLDLVADVTAAQVKDGADVLASAIAATQANADMQALVKHCQRKIDKREGILEQVMEATQASDAPEPGTLWSGYNAFTRVATHGKIGKESRDENLRAERRFESVLTGERDQMTQAALSVALATAN